MKKILLCGLLSGLVSISFAESQDDVLFSLKYSNLYTDHSSQCANFLKDKPEIGIFVNKDTQDLLIRYYSLYSFVRDLQQDNNSTSAAVEKDSDIYDQLLELYQVANSKQRPIILKLLNNQPFESQELDCIINQHSEKFNRILNEPLNITELKEGDSNPKELVDFLLRNASDHHSKKIGNITVDINHNKQSLDAYAIPVKSGMYTQISTNGNDFNFDGQDTTIRCYLSSFGSSTSVMQCSCRAK